MNLRITPQTQASEQIANLRAQTDLIAQLQQQASTGKRILLPSDGPLDYAALLRGQATAGLIGADQSNVTAAQGRLDSANSSLLDVTQALTRARQIAIEGANADLATSDRQGLAEEANQLAERVLGDANQELDGRYLFGGTATGSAPFQATRDATGQIAAVNYQGSVDDAKVLVGPGQQANSAVSGAGVFQRPGQDVFAALIGLRDDLLNGGGTSVLEQRLTGVEAAQTGLLDAVGSLSSDLTGLQNLGDQLGDQSTQAQARIGDLQGADLASVVVRLTQQQTLLSATLAVTARIGSQSLLDFLQ
jgi:flagellar hook-associated protein 3 FlgL